MYILTKKWKIISLLIAVIMVLATVTAFASSESLTKNVDRIPRLYYVGEEVVLMLG